MSPQLLNALAEYVRLTEEQDSLDKAPCSCDSNNFWTCENCREWDAVRNNLRRIEKYSQAFILELARREGIVPETEVEA